LRGAVGPLVLQPIWLHARARVVNGRPGSAGTQDSRWRGAPVAPRSEL